jgi:ATP-dependent DNA ligase
VKTAHIDESCAAWTPLACRVWQTQAATDGERGVHLTYCAFDLLHLNGWDLSSLPLTRRRELLEPMVTNKAGVQFDGHDTGDGELILKHAGKLGFEGVVSKTVDALTHPETAAFGAKPKRSTDKSSSSSAGPTRKDRGPISAHSYSATIPMTVNSFTPGRVGTGMPDKVLADLRRRLEPLARKSQPLSVQPPRKTRFGSPLVLSRVHWVEPKLLAEITFLT